MKLIRKKTLYFLVIVAILFLTIYNSKVISSGVKNGIYTCINLVIPSLFIFMVISNIIINSKLGEIISLPFSPIAKHIFGIDKSLFSIVILSLIGGYPIGAKLIANKVKSGELTVKTANNMLCYCVNCGPAFLISGVGVAVYNSLEIGLMLYFSQVIPCFFIGFLLRNKNDIIIKTKKKQYQKSSVLLVNAVNDSVKSMGLVCGFIVLFAGFIPLLNNISSPYKQLLNGFLEVTTACFELSGLQHALVLTGIFTAFGGICVHMQISAMLNGSGVSLKKFYLFRLLYCTISGLIMWVLVSLNPQVTNCFGITRNTSAITSISPLATIFLILLSIILLFFTKKFVKINE